MSFSLLAKAAIFRVSAGGWVGKVGGRNEELGIGNEGLGIGNEKLGIAFPIVVILLSN